MKRCMSCKEDKSESEFHKESCRKDGLCRRCRTCESDRKKRFTLKGGHKTQEKREKGRIKANTWRKNNPEKAAFMCKRYAKNNRDKVNEIWHRWKSRNIEKYRSQYTMQNAVRYGKIMRPEECSKCAKKCIPEGHHHDYSKPLDVTWLCKKCHEGIHHVD